MELSTEFCVDWIFFSIFFVTDQVWHPYINTGTIQLLKMWLLYDIGKLFFRMNPKLHNLLQAKAMLQVNLFLRLINLRFANNAVVVAASAKDPSSDAGRT